jgi:carbon-monoxide dehydrogenase medium subunit
MMNARLAAPEHVVDINRLDELAHIGVDGDRLVVGALVRHETMVGHPLVREKLPLLARIAASIAHWPIRTRGTVGGSLAHADPAGQWPLAAVLLEAELVLASQNGSRSVAAAAFFAGALATTIEPDELLTEVRFRLPARDHRFGFRHLARRPGDYAIAMAACVIEPGYQRLALGGVEPVPLDRSAALAELHRDIATTTAAASDGLSPMDDPRAPQAYRAAVLPAVIGDCLAEALSARPT